MNIATDTMTGYEDTQPGGGLAAQLEAVRRRALPMGIAFGVVLMLALLLAAFWPATYRSTGTILIEQQEIPEDFVRSAVSSYADQRVQVISQRVMTSANLLGIIEKFELYGVERDASTREELVERIREDINLDMISADVVDPRQGRATKATIAFAVGYDSRSPDLAARVANDLVSLYLRENLESRKQLAAGSADFLTGEAEKLRLRVAELEQRISEFKEKNFDRLPEYAQANIQAMNRAMEELRDVDSRVRALDQQVVYLDAQLAQIDPNAQAVTKSGERMLSSVDRLQALRLELTAALAQYTPKHPVVIGLQQEIDELQKQVTAGTAGSRTAPDNPAYIQITAQREAAVNERTSLGARRGQLQARIAEYERAQVDMPAVERDYGAMLREVQGEQAKLAEVRQKQMAAQLAQNLESEQKGERFTLIEPPLRPEKPIRPNRPVILAIGVLMSLAAALGLMTLLESFDTRVRGRGEIVAMLGVPPLAIIPWVADEPDQDLRRRARRLLVGGTVGGAVVLLLLVHVLVKPLDVLWAILLRRLGG